MTDGGRGEEMLGAELGTGYKDEIYNYTTIVLTGNAHKINKNLKYVINLKTNIIYSVVNNIFVVFGKRQFDEKTQKYKILKY